MKRCPTCNRTFTDQNLSFCIDDGTPLLTVESTEETVLSPPEVPAYQPPSYVPPGGSSKRRTWPWVLGILALIVIAVVGIGIAAAIFVPNMLRSVANANRAQSNNNESNTNGSNTNDSGISSSQLNSNANTNSNANANSPGDNGNSNSNSNAELSPAPTDQARVLSDLRALEDEWTMANINADKKRLDRILADDFVGSFNGETHGKAQYLNDIKRDTVTQKWDFDDLQLSLHGNRATLTGTVRFTLPDHEESLHFVDKFVWRDGRWQATSSEVSQIK